MSTGLNVTVTCAGVRVQPGDIIFGDLDGVVCIPQGALSRVVEMGEELFNTENTFEQEIKANKPLLKVFECLRKTEEG